MTSSFLFMKEAFDSCWKFCAKLLLITKKSFFMKWHFNLHPSIHWLITRLMESTSVKRFSVSLSNKITKNLSLFFAIMGSKENEENKLRSWKCVGVDNFSHALQLLSKNYEVSSRNHLFLIKSHCITVNK